MAKKILHPAVLKAKKIRDKEFEETAGIWFRQTEHGTCADFGRNRVLKGQKKTKKK
jgi:hypothetical protein